MVIDLFIDFLLIYWLIYLYICLYVYLLIYLMIMYVDMERVQELSASAVRDIVSGLPWRFTSVVVSSTNEMSSFWRISGMEATVIWTQGYISSISISIIIIIVFSSVATTFDD